MAFDMGAEGFKQLLCDSLGCMKMSTRDNAVPQLYVISLRA